MSKQRIIKDSFWTDSYIERLTPDEKLVFLYLLTNPLCNIAGVYEIRSKRIAFETGYDIEVIETILKRFEKEKKILRQDDWIIIINFVKNQSTNPSVEQGVARIINELPVEIAKVYPVYRLGTGCSTLLNSTLLNLSVRESKDSKESKKKL